MSIERDELVATRIEAQLKVYAADTVEGHEAACCVADDALDALTNYDRKRGIDIRRKMEQDMRDGKDVDVWEALESLEAFYDRH